MTLEKTSGCKVNLLLNILGRRADGFHELETVMQPLPLYDRLKFKLTGTNLVLECDHSELPTDSRNLVYRAAKLFFATTSITGGVRISLNKNIPLAAGLGGGSANAAVTLAGLNELFGFPLSAGQISPLAASLGSDVPFFLQDEPALATGRGEKIESCQSFPALRGSTIILVHPGFGVSTAWAYNQLAKFPEHLNGKPGRARRLIDALQKTDPSAAAALFYNSLEAPVLDKYPLLKLLQGFFRSQGVMATLMSGSGSTTFAIVREGAKAQSMLKRLREDFGNKFWTAAVPLP